MKYCVLLDAMENEAKIVSQKDGEDLLRIAYRLIHCDTIQLVPVYPNRLPKGYEAVCDEDSWGKMQIFNPLASWLYGCDDHGTPIVNNAVIFKTSSDDFVWMTEDEAKAIAEDLNARADEIFEETMSAAMGIRK